MTDQVKDYDRHMMNMKANNNGSSRQATSVAAVVEILRPAIFPPCIVLPVPPSSTKNRRSGVHAIGAQLAAGDGRIVDGAGWLHRTHDKDEAHSGGDRSIERTLETLEVRNGTQLAGARVLILDDIEKTGNTLRGVRQLLEPFQPAQVEALILGCTGGRTEPQ